MASQEEGQNVFLLAQGDRKERRRVVGLATMTDAEAFTEVGRLGLDELVGKSDPTTITFGELAEKYLADYPFNKKSTRDLHQQIVRNILMPRWSDDVAVDIDPPQLKAWFLDFDVESSTRGKYKSVMSGVYTWAQCESLIARGEQFNPCRYVKGREFSPVTGYEAMALELEDIFAILSELKSPEYELTLLVVACQLRISECLGLRWRNILWDRKMITIRQTFVRLTLQNGAKTKRSGGRSRFRAWFSTRWPRGGVSRSIPTMMTLYFLPRKRVGCSRSHQHKRTESRTIAKERS